MSLAFTLPAPLFRLSPFPLSKPLHTTPPRPRTPLRACANLHNTPDFHPLTPRTQASSTHLSLPSSPATSFDSPPPPPTSFIPESDDGHHEPGPPPPPPPPPVKDLPADLSALSADAAAAYMKAVSNPLTALLARMHGFRMRVAADPSFPFKLLMEETVGLSLAASGMVAARGDKIWEELDFAICDIAVGGALNFILVYLLSPVHGASASGYVGTLPANAFSTGAYTLAQRLAGFLYRGVLFAACGFGGSVVGTGLSQALIYGRRGVAKMKGVEMGVQKKLPNVVANSFAWAGFMLVSANPRYQSVAGVERVLYGFGNGWGKIGSAVLRTANNVAGGANWVVWAKFIGLQECGDEDDDAGESKEK